MSEEAGNETLLGDEDKAGTDAAAKAAADKTAADRAKLSPEDRAKAEAADKAAADKAIADKAKQGAPEKYEAFTMPEGMKLDEELSSELQSAAKEMNLTQAQAQKVADMGAKQAAKFKAAFDDSVVKVRAEWAEQARADKEIGGEKLKENLGLAKKVMQAFGSESLGKFVEESGLGNHPEFIRLLWKVGQSVSEDKLVVGSKPANQEQGARTFAYGKSDHQR